MIITEAFMVKYVNSIKGTKERSPNHCKHLLNKPYFVHKEVLTIIVLTSKISICNNILPYFKKVYGASNFKILTAYFTPKIGIQCELSVYIGNAIASL